MDLKRILDVLLAVCGLLALSSVLVIVALMIRFTSKGGALFIQDRVGRNEVIFKCLKFRTMAKDTPDVGSHEADRSWVTPLGRILRKTKLDELPQLVNVLKGEMSLVGPRPCLPSQEELICARRTFNVFSMRPGITGIAQIQGVDMSTPWELAELDAAYLVKNDVRTYGSIIYRTVLGQGRGDAAKGPG